MIVEELDNVLLVVHGAHPPTDAEWLNYLLRVRRIGVTGARQLVVTDGGLPTVVQRGLLQAELGGRPMRVAIVVMGGLLVFVQVWASSVLDSHTKTFRGS